MLLTDSIRFIESLPTAKKPLPHKMIPLPKEPYPIPPKGLVADITAFYTRNKGTSRIRYIRRNPD